MFEDDERAEREQSFADTEPRQLHDDEHDETSALCEPHALAFGVTRYVRVPEAREQGPDEPIECERCALVIMKRLGVI